MNGERKRALVTGMTGQDGSFLTELLLADGHEVWGLVREGSQSDLKLAEHLRDQVGLVTGDLLRPRTLAAAVGELRPDELYHLAGPTFVPDSWRTPERYLAAIAGSTATLLQAVSELSPSTRLLVATSGEIFGDAPESPQTEQTPCRPRSPYGIAKLASHLLVGRIREHTGIFACSGILYNHESERRPERFVSRRITRAAAEIKLGLTRELTLGDTGAVRDWSFAGDIMAGCRLILGHDRPDDYVLCSGIPHTVQDLVDTAFAHAGLDPERYVRTDPSLVRAPEPIAPIGDPGRARAQLGWRATVSFEQLIARMVDADLRELGERA